jgi:hypothetical protein
VTARRHTIIFVRIPISQPTETDILRFAKLLVCVCARAEQVVCSQSLTDNRKGGNEGVLASGGCDHGGVNCRRRCRCCFCCLRVRGEVIVGCSLGCDGGYIAVGEGWVYGGGGMEQLLEKSGETSSDIWEGAHSVT